MRICPIFCEYIYMEDIQMNTLITLKDITTELEKGIRNLYDNEAYRSYLETMSRFHHYSYRNTLLIWLQNPKASYVAGYKAWMTQFNRYVKKGEKGIRIFAPIKAKQKPDEDEEIISYKAITVFDVSQTEGSDLPAGFTKQLLGEIENDDKYIEALMQISPVPVRFHPLEETIGGYYAVKEKEIVINSTLSSMQKVKSLIHEITHSLLHTPEDGKAIADIHTREVEAESVAYTVLKHYGYDTSDYSFGYIADWSKSKALDEFKNSINRIVSTSDFIIQKIDTILGN